MENYSISTLPSESFIPFHAYRFKNPELIWNARGLEQFDPLKYALGKPCDGESTEAYLPASETLLAERYGGPGLSNNAGGVRCGILDAIQIKGCGKTPLAGRDTDYWHKHGAASLQDCVKEALWGEILSAALPWGAARCPAVIFANSRFPVEVGEYKTPGFAHRALLLRQPVLRPAHYMRSIFQRSEPGVQLPVSDYDRTKAAVSSLFRGRDIDAVTDFLCTSFSRAGAQLAASRARRLIHGSLTASNFGMDGKWLDFGTMTASSGFFNLIVAPGSVEFWKQEQTIFETIYDFCFYLGKFASDASEGVNERTFVIAKCFQDSLHANEETELLRLTGLPNHLLESLPALPRKRLLDRLMQIIRQEGNRTLLYFGDDRHEMPQILASENIGSILVICAIARTSAEAGSSLERLGMPATRATEFASAYFDVRELFKKTLPSQNYRYALVLNCIRRNHDTRPLWRKALDHKIDALCRDEAEGIGLWINKTAEFWQSIFVESSNIPLNPWLTDENIVINRHDFSVCREGVVLDEDQIRSVIERSNIRSDLKLRVLTMEADEKYSTH